jgi:hypothetical protein
MAEPQRERPADDPRFTFRVTLDVAGVLAKHGYPIEAGAGKDLVELQQALFSYLYDATDLGMRPVIPKPAP